MAKFEVFIPAAGPASFDLTFRVEADNWLGALNTGLKKIGEKGGAGSNFLVDIQDDNSIHVTDPKSSRVFRISEMQPPPVAAEDAVTPPPELESNPFDPLPGRKTQLELPAIAPLAAAEPATLPPTPAMNFQPEVSATQAEPATTRVESGGSARETQPGIAAVAFEPPRNQAVPTPAPAARAPSRPPTIPPANYNPSRPVQRPKSGFVRRPSGVARDVTEVPREQARPPTGRIGREKPVPAQSQAQTDEVLVELFERVQELERFTSPEEALDFVLDLAMDKIAAESGSIFLADLSTNDLTLATARGPKSQELLRLNPRIPMGVGIVGFCSQEGVSLAISDVHRDPRFFRAIAERIGYEAKTILCVPILRNGRSFGCLEVLNKKVSNRFTEGELAILAYLTDATARYLETVG